jgi:CRISPR-associated endoribonuclease Cas6
MPHALKLTLDRNALRGQPRNWSRALYRQMLLWIGQAQDDAPQRLHDRGQQPADDDDDTDERRFQAFTVAPADARGGLSYFVTTLARRDPLSASDAALAGDDEEAFIRRLCKAIDDARHVEIDGRWVALAEEPTIVGARSYDDLIDAADLETTIRLRFTTPTFFRTGRLRMLSPDPQQVFTGYAARWNRHAPARLRLDPVTWRAWLAENVQMAAIDVRSSSNARAGRDGAASFPQIGFTGEVEYDARRARDSSEPALRWLNALADYAEYCGTGNSAAFGFGQTYRVK